MFGPRDEAVLRAVEPLRLKPEATSATLAADGSTPESSKGIDLSRRRGGGGGGGGGGVVRGASGIDESTDGVVGGTGVPLDLRGGWALFKRNSAPTAAEGGASVALAAARDAANEPLDPLAADAALASVTASDTDSDTDSDTAADTEGSSEVKTSQAAGAPELSLAVGWQQFKKQALSSTACTYYMGRIAEAPEPLGRCFSGRIGDPPGP
jgi:hypothetical protein